MLSYKTCAILGAFATIAVTLLASKLLSLTWPTVSWLPRIGGTSVGVAVFVQGYVGVNQDRFNVLWRWGLTREQVWLHLANFFAVGGTFMWAFGDLLPNAH
jgi:hypothetical protein